MIRLIQQNVQQDRHFIDFYPVDCRDFFKSIGAKHYSGTDLSQVDAETEGVNCQYFVGKVELDYEYEAGIASKLSAKGEREEIKKLEGELLKFRGHVLEE